MLLGLALAGAAACGEPDGGTGAGTVADRAAAGPDGTVRMVERLRELAESADPRENVFLNRQRARALRESPRPDGFRDRAARRVNLAKELLHAGEWEEAIAELAALRRELEEGDRSPPEGALRTIRDLEAAAHLHAAVQQNCVRDRAPRRCLFPVPEDGVFPEAGNARRAAVLYASFLEDHPDDLLARWLLNYAHMAAGSYPGEPDARWRIPPSAFEPEDRLHRFRDRAPAAGVDVPGHAGGGVLDDLDGDGRLDLMVSSRGLDDPLRYFHNRGNGLFEERTASAGLEGLTGGLNLAQADYDNDGDLDVLVLRGGWLPRPYPNSLLENRGDGTFVDVTEEVGLLMPRSTQVGRWADYDGDGRLDLFVGVESPDGDAGRSLLFRNAGPGPDGRWSFREVAAEVGLVSEGFVKGADWGDVDNDDRPELYVSRLGQPNQLFLNEGPGSDGRWSFREAGREAGVAGPRRSFPAWFFDYDNDGWMDLFVSGYWVGRDAIPAEVLGREPEATFPRLYRNQGDGTFRDVTREAGLHRVLYTMGSNYGDLDGDGYPDVYVGTGEPDLRMLSPARAFRNSPDPSAPGGRRFREVTSAAGLGHVGKGHAVSFGDVDGDGDQDVHVVFGGAYEGDVYRNALFENPGHGHGWITLRLEGREANRSALGSRIAVTVVTPDGERTVRTVVSGGGSFGASSLQAEIGLGQASAIRRVEVRWAGSGVRQVLTGLEMSRVYRIVEGRAEADAVPAAGFEFGEGGG